MKTTSNIVLLLFTAALFYLLGSRATLQTRVKTITHEEPETNSGLHANESLRTSEGIIREGQPASFGRTDVNPFVVKANSYERGYEAASTDLENALTQLQNLPATERKAFAFGVFSWVAKNKTPADALHIATKLPETVRGDALRGLVGEWILTQSEMAEDHRSFRRDLAFTTSGSRLGLEAELASLLSGAQLPTDIRTSWLDSFANHSSRSEMLLMFSGGIDKHYAESLFARIEGWSPWEKQRGGKAILSGLAYSSPEEAWQWYQENQLRFGMNHSEPILEIWASKDFDAVNRLLNGTESPEQRSSILKVISKLLAQKNTEEALDWANSLSDGGEREKAHTVIYDTAPRGVGAMLAIQEGFPTVHGVVPGSPLAQGGVRVGDQIFEAQEGNAAPRTLYGSDLSSAINLLRGEPGTTVTLRLLRKNAESGQLQEHVVPITRAQLYLDEKHLPPRFIPVKDQ